MKNQRILLLIALIIIMLAIIASVSYWLLLDKKQLLFADLDPKDTAAIAAELEHLAIKYQMSDDATSISVSQQDMHQARIKIMNSGIALQGPLGFELFDKSDFGMTEFAQKINYQRAIEGELSRTISALKEIRNARVHLVIPENRLFVDHKKSATAVVTLFSAPEVVLTATQIKGIQRIVSAAVPDLESPQVTIIDQHGNPLSSNKSGSEEEQDITQRFEKKKQLETYFSSKLHHVLDNLLGDGNAIISVDISLKHQDTRTTREEIIPNKSLQDGLVRERSLRNQSSLEEEDAVQYEADYQHGRQVQKISAPAGNITRISVGVLIRGHYSAPEIDDIRYQVEAAVGFDSSRGDVIVVSAVKPAIKSQLAPIAITQPQTIERPIATGDEKEPEPLALPKSKDSMSQSIDQIRPFLGSLASLPQTQIIIILLLLASLALLLLLWIISTLFGSKAKSEPQLSTAEREKVLHTVKTWLDGNAS